MAAGTMVPMMPPHLLTLPTQSRPLRAMNVAIQYIASTTTRVNTRFEASAASAVGSVPMKAMLTAPKVSTVGYQIVDCIHCSHIAKNPTRGPYASPTQRNTPPCLFAYIAASSAATIAVGIRNTIAANRQQNADCRPYIASEARPRRLTTAVTFIIASVITLSLNPLALFTLCIL